MPNHSSEVKEQKPSAQNQPTATPIANETSTNSVTPTPFQPSSVQGAINRLRAIPDKQARQQQFATLQRLYGNAYATKIASQYSQSSPSRVVARQMAAPQNQIQRDDDDGVTLLESGNTKLTTGVTGIKALEDDGDTMLKGGSAEYEYGEEEQTGLLDKLQEIKIDILKVKNEGQALGGEREAEGGVSVGLEGLEYEGAVNFKWDSSVLNKESDEADLAEWNVQGEKIKTKGKVSAYLGSKAEAGVEGGVKSLSEASAKGKASAFAGGAVDIEITAGVENLGKVKGTLGVSYGVGGEIEAEIKWSGGVIKLKSKGKVAAGLGFSYGYEVELDTPGLLKRGLSALWSGAKYTGGALWSGAKYTGGALWSGAKWLAGY